MAATQRNIFPLIIIIGLFSASIFSFAQSKDLDPEKWVVALSKKDRSPYDSIDNLTGKLEQVDSLKGFQFLDELAEKGRSKGDHFKALFNCLKARNIYNKCYYESYRIGKTPVNVDSIKREIMKLCSSAIDIAYRSEDDMLPICLEE